MKRHTVLIGKKQHFMSIELSVLETLNYFSADKILLLTPSAASVSPLPQTAFTGGLAKSHNILYAAYIQWAR